MFFRPENETSNSIIFVLGVLFYLNFSFIIILFLIYDWVTFYKGMKFQLQLADWLHSCETLCLKSIIITLFHCNWTTTGILINITQFTFTMIFDLIMTWLQRRNVVGFNWKIFSVFVKSILSLFF